jgi:hypothetical protein
MIRYYPSFATKKNLKTNGKEFLLNGKPYSGMFYETYDNQYYTGVDPIHGENELLTPIKKYSNSPFLIKTVMTDSLRSAFAENSLSITNNTNNTEPVPYYPLPTSSDYGKGFIIRYFIKKINSKGYVIEISPDEYNSVVNGTSNYDVSFYQVVDILWKITGPLETKRLSQYDIRAGIVDTNKRLVEQANKTFLGITDFIGGDYTKFAKPTS